MTENIPAAYSSSMSPGNPHQQYAYQTQVNSAGAQFYGGGNSVDQQVQETIDHQIHRSGGQEANYAQYGGNTAELAAGQQASFGEQANPEILQQFAGVTGQLAQQQGPNGYKINFDPNPQIIRKNANDAVTYKQEVAVRYLRPPTPPPPGPLIIKEVSYRINLQRESECFLLGTKPSFTGCTTNCYSSTTSTPCDTTTIDHSRTTTTTTRTIGTKIGY